MKQCALVTGCSSGIGRATALAFQRQGWNVVATMRYPEKEVEPGSTRTNASMQHEFPGAPLFPEYGSTCKAVTQFMKHRYETEVVAEPEEVARVIYQAAVSTSKRYRYLAGRDAKMGDLMKRFLPDHIFKQVASRMMGLSEAS